MTRRDASRQQRFDLALPSFFLVFRHPPPTAQAHTFPLFSPLPTKQIVVSASPQLVGVGAVQFVWLRDGGMVDAAPNARTLVLEAALRSDAGR